AAGGVHDVVGDGGGQRRLAREARGPVLPAAREAGAPMSVQVGRSVLRRGLARYFDLARWDTDLPTEIRAGVTTFMVMAYIIFVNPIVLGFVGVPGLEGRGLPFGPTLSVTCLTAGLLTIAMGLASNYPFALAPGMGLNAVVAFELVASRGLTWPQAMTVIFVEGLVITLLVLTRLREAVLDALLLGIVLTTVLAVAANGLFAGWQGFATAGAARIPTAIVRAPDFSTFGRLDFGFVGRLGAVTAVLATFSIMLSDFFDTIGTIVGVGGKGGFLDARGRLPRANRVLLVDSLGAMFGGLA